MNKRGMTETFVISMIILLITFFIVLGILMMWGFDSVGEADEQACRLSLVFQKNTKLGFIDSPLKNICEKRLLSIEEDRVNKATEVTLFGTRVWSKEEPQVVYVQGKRVESYSAPTDDIVASVLAESMRRCWAMGSEGRQPLFNSKSVFDRQTACLICDEFTVEVDGQYCTQQTLSAYLQNPMPNDGEQRTYREYLLPDRSVSVQQSTSEDAQEIVSGSERCLKDARINVDPVISSGSYATVLFRDFSVVSDGCMATYVVPEAKLRSLCDYVAN